MFDFGIEVRTDGIEVQDSSSQECMNLGNLNVRFISYFDTIFSFLYTNYWYSERVISYMHTMYCNSNTNRLYSNAEFWYLEDPVRIFGFTNTEPCSNLQFQYKNWFIESYCW